MGRHASTTLTEREREILALYAAGHTARYVAAQLGVTVNTLQNHMSKISQRTGARNRTQAVAIAMRRGWIE